MDAERTLNFYEKQIEMLERERASALEALDLAASLGNFETSFSQQADCMPILLEICRRANLMIPFRSTAVYLVDQDTQDLGLEHHDREEFAEAMNKEMDGLIMDQSFSYAMQTLRPCFFLASDKQRQLLLHAIATPSRMRGMFMGMLEQSKETIPDTVLSLFTVVMQAGAHALESFELNLRFRQHRSELERKVRERTAQLEEANEHLNTVLNNILAGVLLVNASTHTIVDINPAGLQMIGYTHEEVVGKKCFQFLCPSEAGYCPITDEGHRFDNAERLMITKSGDKIPILKTVSWTLLGGAPHLIETFIDISEQKKLTQLKEDIDRITRHDLKSPLHGIIGVPDYLLETLELSPQDRSLLQGVKEAGVKMLQMINMSLDLYKMEMDSYEFVPEDVDIGKIIKTVLSDLESSIKTRQLQLSVKVNGQEVEQDAQIMLQGEDLLFLSMMGNLIKNAVEAAPPDSPITIAIHTGEENSIEIRNQGEVPESIRDTFFDKYATAGKKYGTGLGTYSARLIAHTMGGSIKMTSDPVQGVAVTVTLPRMETGDTPGSSFDKISY